MRRFTIRKQRYPDSYGEHPLSYAIYYGRTFIAYSWTFSGAWIALQVIRSHSELNAKKKYLNLDLQIRALELPAPVKEYRFCERRWRFDYAWPEQQVALELEGGAWIQGRHQRPQGFANDCLKYSEAAILGWKVIRVTTDMVADGTAIELLQRALNKT